MMQQQPQQQPPDSIWNYDYDGSGNAVDGNPGSGRQSKAGSTNPDPSLPGVNDDNESVLTDMISPSGHADAQTLACMLQEQLDAINNEIRSVLTKKNPSNRNISFHFPSKMFVLILKDDPKKFHEKKIVKSIKIFRFLL